MEVTVVAQETSNFYLETKYNIHINSYFKRQTTIINLVCQ